MNAKKKISILIITMFMLVMAPSVFAVADITDFLETTTNVSDINNLFSADYANGFIWINDQSIIKEYDPFTGILTGRTITIDASQGDEIDSITFVEDTGNLLVLATLFIGPPEQIMVFEYTLDGVYTGFNMTLNNTVEEIYLSMTNNGSSIFVGGFADTPNVIYEYDIATNEEKGVFFDTTGLGGELGTLEYNPDRNSIFLTMFNVGSSNGAVEYDMAGVQTGLNISYEGQKIGTNYRATGLGYAQDTTSYYIVTASNAPVTERNFIHRYAGVGNYVLCGEALTSSLTMTHDLLRCDAASDGLIINVSDVTLDCNGFKIASGAQTDSGILLGSQADDVTIQNCEVLNFQRGIDATGCFNTSNLIVQDTFLDNSTIGVDFFHFFAACGDQKFFMQDLTMNNVNFSARTFAIDMDVDVCSLNNLQFTCPGDPSTGDCETTVYFDAIRDCSIDGWTTTNAFDIGIYIADPSSQEPSFKAEGNTFRNVFLNVTNGATWGQPIGFLLDRAKNTFVELSEIVSDDVANLFAFQHGVGPGVSNQTTVIDVIYPFAKEDINNGKFVRLWTSTITTNIPDVDVSLTPITGNVINTNTGSAQQVVLTLLEYERNSSDIINSTPYDVIATRTSTNKPTFQQFQLSFTPTNSLFPNILLAYTGFTLPELIFAGIASLAGMAALILLTIGLFIQMTKGKK